MIAAICAVAVAILAHGWLTTTLPLKDSPALGVATATALSATLLVVLALTA